MKYKIQFQTKSDPRWVEMGAEDNLDTAIGEAARRNKLHRAGTMIHRVIDSKTHEPLYVRGWLET